MKFIVKNRSDIHNAFYPGGSAILISITDPDKDHCIPSGKFRDVLCVKFHDADVESPGIQLIDDDIVEIMLDFVREHCDVDYVVVNCEAGVSRSAGVAAALSKIFTGDDFDIVKIKPFYNKKVYRTIMGFEDRSGPCPDCGKSLVDGDSWSGVKCPDEKCGYWFCY